MFKKHSNWRLFSTFDIYWTWGDDNVPITIFGIITFKVEYQTADTAKVTDYTGITNPLYAKFFRIQILNSEQNRIIRTCQSYSQILQHKWGEVADVPWITSFLLKSLCDVIWCRSTGFCDSDTQFYKKSSKTSVWALYEVVILKLPPWNILMFFSKNHLYTSF